MAVKVDLIGDRDAAERLRGFALSQLRILHNLMEFQKLKQYSRVVYFANESYVHTFSCFGMDLVTIYVPPGAIPSEEIVKIEEGTFVFVEHIEIDVEIYEPDINCTYQWVVQPELCGLSGNGTLKNYSCSSCSRWWSYELIVGDEKQVQLTAQYCTGSASSTANCIDPDHNPPETVRWDHYTDYSVCADPAQCALDCNGNQDVGVASLHYYKWECA